MESNTDEILVYTPPSLPPWLEEELSIQLFMMEAKKRACLGGDGQTAPADWSAMLPDLLRIIAGLIDGIEDYIRFGAVCKPWNSATFSSYDREGAATALAGADEAGDGVLEEIVQRLRAGGDEKTFREKKIPVNLFQANGEHDHLCRRNKKLTEESIRRRAPKTLMAEPRRLRGHKATATCCISSLNRPGLVATSGEDGCICWFDMRCKDVLFAMDAFQDPISSLCFKTGNEDVIYASSGAEVKCFDVHQLTSWKPLESYNYNKEEINQVVCNSKSSFLAAADDGGDVKIIDIHQHCLYKTLRAGHTSICSSVQFLPWRPWEVITGGLDSKLVMWDFSKGRPYKVMDFGTPDDSGSNAGQLLNPAFIHAIAVPDVDMLDRTDKICAVARGDGIVDVNHIEQELAASKSRGSIKPHKGFKCKSKDSASAADTENPGQTGSWRLHLDYSFGGHTAAVSCVTFSSFGEKGKLIISGGNDKFVKVWDLSRCIDVGKTSSLGDVLCKDIKLSKKVNWLCTTPCDSENLVVCDTTKVVKVYNIL